MQRGAAEEDATMMGQSELREWARTASVGDYLAKWEDVQGPDDGSRGGYSDSELAALGAWLNARDLSTRTDDVGIVVIAKVQS